MEVLYILISLVCFWFFNAALFAAFNVQTGLRPSSFLSLWVAFFVNYSVLFLLFALQLPLPINWAVIAVVLVVEVRLLYNVRPLLCLFLGLSGAILGLVVNLFCHAVPAVLLDLPLQDFDINLAEPTLDMRVPALCLGFLMGAVLLWVGCVLLRPRKFRYLNRSTNNLRFTLCLIGIQLCYLLLTLLIYALPSNEFVLKLWGIKTGVCVLLGYAIGVWFAGRESSLEYFAGKTRLVRKKLADYRKREEALEEQVFTDELTGCRSRSFGKQALEECIRKNKDFVLCFVDIDRLKVVNDELGHAQGNRYISVVAQVLTDILDNPHDVLCRFGGDEFFLIFHDRQPAEVEEILKDAAVSMATLSWSPAYPFECSISYGLVGGEGATDASQLLRMADEKMYAQKMAARAARAPRSLR